MDWLNYLPTPPHPPNPTICIVGELHLLFQDKPGECSLCLWREILIDICCFSLSWKAFEKVSLRASGWIVPVRLLGNPDSREIGKTAGPRRAILVKGLTFSEVNSSVARFHFLLTLAIVCLSLGRIYVFSFSLWSQSWLFHWHASQAWARIALASPSANSCFSENFASVRVWVGRPGFGSACSLHHCA